MTPATILARPLVQRFESCRLAPYLDPAGIPTIGWGATALAGKPVTMATPPITRAAADAALDATLAAVETRVRAAVHVSLADHEAAALISLAYNIGTGALARSTLLRLLNDGERDAAAGQFTAWVYAGGVVQPGLVTRRAAERALFTTPPIPLSQGEGVSSAVGAKTAQAAADAADTLNAAEITKDQPAPARTAGTTTS